MAERRIFRPLELPHDGVLGLLLEALFPANPALCKLHRKEPGWFVGEHIQVLFWGEAAGFSGRVETDIDWFGEPSRSRAKLREGEVYFARVGEVGRRNDERAGLKAEEAAEAKQGEDVDGVVAVLNRPEGVVGRRTGPLDLRGA